jgi:hypothetical protein
MVMGYSDSDSHSIVNLVLSIKNLISALLQLERHDGQKSVKFIIGNFSYFHLLPNLKLSTWEILRISSL